MSSDKMLDNAKFSLEHLLHLKSRILHIYGDPADCLPEFMSSLAVLEEQSNEPIIIYISSLGGDWYDGMAIHDRICASKCHITTLAIGKAMSMGSVILQAGDIRCAFFNTTIMVHDGYEDNGIQTPADQDMLVKHSKQLRSMMYKIYANKSHHPVNYWKRVCKKDKFYTAEEALKVGLIDKILLPSK
jgi:ATP-dependent Clp protease, protease subunit